MAAWAERYRAIWEQRFDRLETYVRELKAKETKMAVSSVANSDTFKVTTPSDREIRITRVFDAPRQLLFEAMSKPEHIKRWWGILDKGYSVPACEVDLRPGGAWRFVNRTPRGEVVAFYGVYREITPPERMVFTEIFEPFPDSESVVTAVFTEENGKTRLTLTSLYPSLEVRDMVLKSGMERGAAISYDRLEEVARQLQRS
jgi:uncharacterized protein YndB with AHSA1/START domain